MTTSPAHCISPGLIGADDLVAYAHGEAEGDVAGHVARCDACRTEADSYFRMRGLLSAGLYRRSCPEAQTLGEYVLGILPPEEEWPIAAHVRDCPACLAERRTLGALLASEDEPAAARSIASGIRRLFASAAPRTTAMAAGLRGSDSGDSITYSVQGMLQMTINVQRTGPTGRGSVAGLVQPEDPQYEGAPVRLYAGEKLLKSDAVDDLGTFVFKDVPAGTYRIEVTIPSAVVVIDPLRVP